MINSKPENLKCPDCDGEMITRTNRQTGQSFWGCKKFPDCKGTRDNEGMSKEERQLQREDEAQNIDNPKSSFNKATENDQFRFRKS